MVLLCVRQEKKKYYLLLCWRKCRKGRQVRVGALVHAPKRRGQDGRSQGCGQRHPGWRGAAELHGVALVCRAAVDLELVGDSQQGAVGGDVAAGGLHAALCVEAHGAGDGWETWRGGGQRWLEQKCTFDSISLYQAAPEDLLIGKHLFPFLLF